MTGRKCSLYFLLFPCVGQRNLRWISLLAYVLIYMKEFRVRLAFTSIIFLLYLFGKHLEPFLKANLSFDMDTKILLPLFSVIFLDSFIKFYSQYMVSIILFTKPYFSKQNILHIPILMRPLNNCTNRLIITKVKTTNNANIFIESKENAKTANYQYKEVPEGYTHILQNDFEFVICVFFKDTPKCISTRPIFKPWKIEKKLDFEISLKIDNVKYSKKWSVTNEG